jgi:hypothetical protein
MEEMRKPCPCDECNKFYACKTKLMACKQFLLYINTGRVQYGERKPTRKLWQKIFVEDTDDEKDQQKKITVKAMKEKIKQTLGEKYEPA